MGRKIPGRKHHGVRDPEKQRLERFKKIKDKINAPPANPDDQQVSKSLERLIELKKKTKNGEFRRRRKKLRPKLRFEQRSDETDRAFLARVNHECAIIKHEAAFEQKFGVEITKNSDGEVVEIKKRPKDPVQVMLKEARKQKKVKKIEVDVPKLTKSQKRRLKLLEKKKKKLNDNIDEFERFQDKVKFGEQAKAPPTLKVPKKFKDSDEVPRPGKKDLLLKTMLSKTEKIDRTAKRKELPNALRRQLDKQQQEVVEAYRLLKAKKREAVK